MSVIQFEVRYGDGRKEVLAVDGERALIGSGSHCHVRLPPDQAASEHVAVEVLGGTVRVETKAFDPPAKINGVPFTTIPVAPDVPLELGGARIFISLADSAAYDAHVVHKKNEEASPLVKAIGVLIIVGGAYMMFFGDEQAEGAAAPLQVPDLFPAKAVTCPPVAPDQALAIATEKMELAEGKRERSPFVPRDGLEAVDLYGLAAACFRRGNTAPADQADAIAAQLKASIIEDFRARRVRLEHLMAVGDYELARQDITALRALMQDKQGPWVSWLASADQTVKQKAPAK